MKFFVVLSSPTFLLSLLSLSLYMHLWCNLSVNQQGSSPFDAAACKTSGPKVSRRVSALFCISKQRIKLIIKFSFEVFRCFNSRRKRIIRNKLAPILTTKIISLFKCKYQTTEIISSYNRAGIVHNK